VYLLAYCLFSTFFKFCHRLKITGKENIPKSDAFIVVANHASYYDPLVLAASLYPRKVYFMAKMELFKIPGFAFVIRKLGAFPVKREGFDRKSLTRAFELIKDKEAIGMFPEGTRVRADASRQIFQGAAYLASKTGAGVLPVRICGTEKIMAEGKRFPRLAKINVNIGIPLKLNGVNKEDLAVFSAKIMEEIEKL